METQRPIGAILCGLVAVAALSLAVGAGGLTAARPLAVGALLLSLAMAAVALTGALLQDAPLRVTLGLRRGRLGALRTTALVAGTIGLSQLLNTLLVQSGWRQQSVLAEIDRTVATAAGAEYALLVAALAMAPGIAEELLFRGLVLRSVAGAFGSTLALGVSALLFALAHRDPAQSAAAAVLGLYLGAIALKGDSIRACVVCHIANNSAALLWVAVYGTSDSAASLAIDGRVLTASAVACAAGLAALATSPRSDAPAGS